MWEYGEMRNKLLCATAALALASWLCSTPPEASCQGNTWAGTNLAQMIDAVGWRLGFLRVNAAFTLANAGYDTDVYYGHLDEPVPDWTFSAGLPVQVLLPLSKKIVLDLSDTPQYLFYLDTVRERALNNTFRGQVHFALNKVYVRAGGGLSDVRRRMSPELDINVREKRDGLDGLVLWQASRTTSFALAYGRTKYDYRDAEYLGTPISERLDRVVQFFNLINYYQPSARTRLLLDGQYGTYAFTGGTSSIGDARSYGVFAGVEFLPRVGEIVGSAGIRGSIKLGYMRFDIVDPEFVDGSGFAGEADVTVDLAKRTSAHVFFSRGYQFSIYSGATFFLSTSYGAGLSQRLSRKATLAYDVSFGHSSYPEDGDVQGIRNRRTGHSFSLSLRLARHLNVTLLAMLNRRVQDATDLSRNRNFFGFSLTYGFSGGGLSAPGGGAGR
jgi:hypothetical protein